MKTSLRALTPLELTSILKNKGIKFQFIVNYFGDLIIGFNNGKGVWVWLASSEHFGTSFVETYSQNTGVCRKGIRHGFKIMDSVESKLLK